MKTIEHPLEEFFNIEMKTTESTGIELHSEVGEITDDSYDSIDKEIHNQSEDILRNALTFADVALSQIPTVEGKNKAEIFNSSAAFLNVALNALKEKRELKKHKDKVSKQDTPKNQTNIVYAGNHSDLLEILNPKK